MRTVRLFLTIIRQKHLILCLFLLVGMIVNAHAQKVEIQFSSGSWFDILRKAQDEGKYIFVDITASWCIPCRQMETEVFTNTDVSVYFNKHFVSYKVNADQSGYSYFKEIYNAEQLPKLFFFNSRGGIIHQLEGKKTTEELLNVAKDIVEARNVNLEFVSGDSEQYRLVELETLYNKGNRYPSLVREYAYLLKKYQVPYNKIVNDYLQSQTRNIRSAENSKFVFDFAFNMDNIAIQYLLKNQHFFQKRYSKLDVQEKIKSAVFNGVLTAVSERDERLFYQTVDLLKKAAIPNIDRFSFEMEALYYQSTANWKSYFKVTNDYLQGRDKKSIDPSLLNDIAWKFYQNVDLQRTPKAKKLLEKSLGWVKTAVNIEGKYDYQHTYAALLFKLGRQNKAIKATQQALEAGKAQGENYQKTLELIDKINVSKKKIPPTSTYNKISFKPFS